MESTAEAHVEGRCLRLHVALEGFAYWVVKTHLDKDEVVVADALAESWNYWVTSHEPEIRALSRGQVLGGRHPDDDDDEDVVVAKVRSAI